MQEKNHMSKQRAAEPGGAGFVKQMTAATRINTVGNIADEPVLIRDAETAEELMALIKASVLAEAETSMLAQANMGAEGLIPLLANWHIFSVPTV